MKKLFFLFFKQKTAYEFSLGLVGSEVCIRDGAWVGRRISGDEMRVPASGLWGSSSKGKIVKKIDKFSAVV